MNATYVYYIYITWLPSNGVKCASHKQISGLFSALNPNIVILPGRMCSRSLHLSANGCKTKMVAEMV